MSVWGNLSVSPTCSTRPYSLQSLINFFLIEQITCPKVDSKHNSKTIIKFQYWLGYHWFREQAIPAYILFWPINPSWASHGQQEKWSEIFTRHSRPSAAPPCPHSYPSLPPVPHTPPTPIMQTGLSYLENRVSKLLLRLFPWPEVLVLLLCLVSSYLSEKSIWEEFPGGPVVRTLHARCRGHGFDPWSGSYEFCSSEKLFLIFSDRTRYSFLWTSFCLFHSSATISITSWYKCFLVWLPHLTAKSLRLETSLFLFVPSVDSNNVRYIIVT